MDSSSGLSNNMLVLGVAVGAGLCAATLALEQLRRAGVFQVLNFDWKELPSDRVLMLKPFKGSYKNVRSSFGEVMKFAKGHPHCPNEVWAFYYDSPEKVGVNNTRYSLGLVMAGEKTQDLEDTLAKNGFVRVDNLPKNMSCLHLSFPFTGVLSVMTSVIRVYSAFAKECKVLGIRLPDNDMSGIFAEVTRTTYGVTEFYFIDKVAEPLRRARFD